MKADLKELNLESMSCQDVLPAVGRSYLEVHHQDPDEQACVH